jgi:(p)ppGpp synthase/HD superfamily hydrolase
MSLLEKALLIATKAHEGQVDKAGESYILHPIRVMLKMSEEYDKIIAVLHDVIEDTSISYEYLRTEGFPEEIIAGIDDVTRREGESYKEFILRAKLNPRARRVKLADLEDNMDIGRIETPTEADFKRLKKYKHAKKILLEE